MIASYYNHFVWSKGDAIIYNAASGAFHYTSAAQASAIHSALDGLPNEQSLFDSLPSEVRDWLTSEGYVVTSQKEEWDDLARQDWEHRQSHGVLALTILPTLECNLRCPYCFQKKLPKFMD